jgi:signal transduction histidine kinase/ActR/RegA family two-component response regulator
MGAGGNMREPEPALAGAEVAAPPAASTGARARRVLAEIGIGALATAGAMLVRAAITPVLGTRIPFLTFFASVTVASRYGGLPAGIFASVLGTLIVAWALLEPAWQLAVHDAGDMIALGIFLATGIGIAYVNESLRRQRAEATGARLEAERAAAIAQQAQREAVAAARAKDEFLSVVGHELRTPLTSILGWANILRTKKSDAETLARALEIIERNALGQAQIIDDLLDVSRIVTGRVRLSLEVVSPAEVVRAALDVVAPGAAAKNVTLDAALDEGAGPIVADAGRLQQIVWNLLSNAVKFNREGGRVEVRLRRVADRVELRVSDTGEGIPREFLPRVFERFTQAEPSPTRAHRGLGLGLAIAQSLVDLHGGTIAAASDGPGKGATFTVTLPCAPATARAPEQRRAAQPAASLAGVRVLVVDDDPDTLDLVATILRAEGAAIITAKSAEEALSAVREAPIDILVSDLNMPGEDGYALLRKASAVFAERRRHVAALALTASAGPKEASRARRAGFAEHLAKPVVPEELVRAVSLLAIPQAGDSRKQAAPERTR